MPLAKQLRFKSFLPSVKLVGVAIAASSLLAGCGGGGGGSSEQATATSRVIAFGDSLTDSGTYGGKYIVNNVIPFGQGSNSLWVDSISQGLGAQEPCPYFRYAGVGDPYLSASYTPSVTCTNFAVGSGRINAAGDAAAAAAGAGALSSPRSIPAQLAAASRTMTFSASDLVLISAAGNDATDLFSGLAGLLAAGNSAAVNSVLTSVPSINQQLILSVVQAAIADELADIGERSVAQATLDGTLAGYGQISASYLAALATILKDQITANLLEEGVQKVVVLNMPNVLATPAFRNLIAGLTPAQSAVAEPFIADLVGVYNVQLASVFAGDPRVFIYDLNAVLSEVSDTATARRLGFSNVTIPACGAISALDCTEGVAAGTVQALFGPSADWETFLWADAIHPGEAAHDLIASRLLLAMQAKGWR